jgi:hypothetical protein
MGEGPAGKRFCGGAADTWRRRSITAVSWRTYFPGYDHIADPHDSTYADYGMKAATVSALFAELRKESRADCASDHRAARGR